MKNNEDMAGQRLLRRRLGINGAERGTGTGGWGGVCLVLSSWLDGLGGIQKVQ